MGDAKISPIDTRDISAAAVRVLLEPVHEGKRYELTGGESLSDGEIAESFSAALRREIRYVCISEKQAKEAMAQAGTPPWLVELLGELNEVAAKGYLAAVQPALEMLLKRQPILFSQFVLDHIAAFNG